jgi:hypothetical protein
MQTIGADSIALTAAGRQYKRLDRVADLTNRPVTSTWIGTPAGIDSLADGHRCRAGVCVGHLSPPLGAATVSKQAESTREIPLNKLIEYWPLMHMI